MKRLLSSFIIMLCTIVSWADRGGYEYDSINFVINVAKDNKWQVEETEYVDFSEPRHGIYRYLTEEFWLDRNVAPAGEPKVIKQMQYKPSVVDKDVAGFHYQIEYNNDNVIFKVGEENSTVIGKQEYKFRYTYVFPDDRTPGYDWMFYSILGDDFNEPINKLSAKIHFEKPLPESALKSIKLYHGKYGDTNSMELDTLILSADSQDVVINLKDIQPRMALTICAELPEGYFEGVKTMDSSSSRTAFYIALVLIVVTILLELFIRSPHITKSIEFYPPEGMSSAEVGTIIDDSVDNIDLASLIPWFASQGYLSIRQLKNNYLQIKKENNLPDDAPLYQKEIMDLLFRDGDEVILDNLGEDYDAIEEIRTEIKDFYSYENKLTKIHYGSVMLLAIAIAGIFTFGLSSPVESLSIGYLSIGIVVFLAFLGSSYAKISATANLISKKWQTWALLAVKVVLTAVALYFWCDNLEYGNFISKEEYAILFIGAFVVQELAWKFRVNTQYRADVAGKLLGLKEFIETAEKPRLETLLEDDPQYFYRILPYALVFRISDKWADQFSEITMEKPEWYSAYGADYNYQPLLLTQILCDGTTSTINTISHKPFSDESGGGGDGFFGGGGGGFSGGGGGGGGGGSW